MFQRTYQKILVGVLLLILGSCGPYLVYKIDVHQLVILSGEMRHRQQQTNLLSSIEMKFSDKQQEVNLWPEEVKHSNKQQQPVSHNDRQQQQQQQQQQPNLLQTRELKFIDKQQKVNPSFEHNIEQQQSMFHDRQPQPNLPSSIATKFIDKQQKVNPSFEHNIEQQQSMFHDRQPQPNLPPSTEAKLIYKQRQVSPSPKEVKRSNEQRQPLSHDRQQQPNLPPLRQTKFVHSNAQQQHVIHDNVTVFKHFIDMSYSRGGLVRYLQSLSSAQAEYVFRQLGFGNLTSREGQVQFLQCAGMTLLQQLRGKQLDLNVHIRIPTGCERCKHMSFQSSGPTIALASYQGSGNSWVRELLESATGIYTGARYCDQGYVKCGMIGEYVDSNNVIAVKIHDSRPAEVKQLMNNDKAIFLVRNPFDAIFADHNRYLTHNNHVGYANYKYGDNPAWKAIIHKQARGWRMYVTSWLNFTDYPVLIVGYENLKRDTYTELKRMLDFIGYPYTEDDVLCALKKSGETFHRKRKEGLHPYTTELEEFVLNEIKQIDADLLKHNISLYHLFGEG